MRLVLYQSPGIIVMCYTSLDEGIFLALPTPAYSRITSTY